MIMRENIEECFNIGPSCDFIERNADGTFIDLS
jgi:hypothetical protein